MEEDILGKEDMKDEMIAVGRFGFSNGRLVAVEILYNQDIEVGISAYSVLTNYLLPILEDFPINHWEYSEATDVFED